MAGKTKRQQTAGDPTSSKSGDTLSVGIAIRGSQEWRAWVNELAKHRRLRTTDLIDQALIEYAERHGFKPPAPRR